MDSCLPSPIEISAGMVAGLCNGAIAPSCYKVLLAGAPISVAAPSLGKTTGIKRARQLNPDNQATLYVRPSYRSFFVRGRGIEVVDYHSSTAVRSVECVV